MINTPIPSKLILTLMRRDGLTYEEAQNEIAEARKMIDEGYDPEELLHEVFGLEPDYVFDLLW